MTRFWSIDLLGRLLRRLGSFMLFYTISFDGTVRLTPFIVKWFEIQFDGCFFILSSIQFDVPIFYDVNTVINNQRIWLSHSISARQSWLKLSDSIACYKMNEEKQPTDKKSVMFLFFLLVSFVEIETENKLFVKRDIHLLIATQQIQQILRISLFSISFQAHTFPPISDVDILRTKRQKKKLKRRNLCMSTGLRLDVNRFCKYVVIYGALQNNHSRYIDNPHRFRQSKNKRTLCCASKSN